MHSHYRLPQLALQDPRRRRVRHRRLGRLVQQPQAPRINRDGSARGIRASPLRCAQTRDAAHMKAARNQGRFTSSKANHHKVETSPSPNSPSSTPTESTPTYDQNQLPYTKDLTGSENVTSRGGQLTGSYLAFVLLVN